MPSKYGQIRVDGNALHMQFTGKGGNRSYGFAADGTSAKLVKALKDINATRPSMVWSSQLYVSCKAIEPKGKRRMIVEVKKVLYSVNNVDAGLVDWLFA